MPATNSVGCTLFLILAVLGIGLSFLLVNPPVPIGVTTSFWLVGLAPAMIGLLLGYLIFLSLRVARQWEKAIVLRLGRFSRTSGPGIFFLWPIIDSISTIVDTRTQITPFKAEQTLSRDTVPVDVDAVLFWFVWDSGKAALSVSDYAEAVSWAAQTALRDTIGKTDLASLLAGREQIEVTLKKMIDERTEPWGITVQSVEMRDVLIPVALQDAMSKEAQAERERHARVILSQAEVEVAQKFNQAALIYGNNPVAMSLRSMNLLADAIKERGALVVVPNNAVETLGLGTITGLTALSQSGLLPNAPQLRPNEPARDPSSAPPPNPAARPQPPQQPGNAAPYSPWPQTGPKQP
ncbi:MAG: slipin family protein [Chloroflexi bacterium]|nr:slipin family protein [Chloroflexota bacterium]